MTINRPRLSRRTLAGLLVPVAAHAQEVGSAPRPLRIGVTAGPHAQVMARVREIAARGGLAIQVVEFTEFNGPNAALAAGELDANSYQHGPFLDQQVRDRGYALVAVGRTMVFPLGVYSRRHRMLDAVPEGGRIAIPDDPSNGGRALILLATQGLFRLRDGVGLRATPGDIVANPRRITVQPLGGAQLPAALAESDAAVITSNFALLAGLDPARDPIAVESTDSPYANLVVVRTADRDAPWVRRLLAAYQTPEIRDFVAATFKGAAVPAF